MSSQIPADTPYLLFPFTGDPDPSKRISESRLVDKLLAGEFPEYEFDKYFQVTDIDAETYAQWMLNVKRLRLNYRVYSVESGIPSEYIAVNEYTRLQPAESQLPLQEFTIESGDFTYSILAGSDPLYTPAEGYVEATSPPLFAISGEKFKPIQEDSQSIGYETTPESSLIISPQRINGPLSYGLGYGQLRFGLTPVFARHMWSWDNYEQPGSVYYNVLDYTYSELGLLSFAYSKEQFKAVTYRNFVSLIDNYYYDFLELNSSFEFSKDKISLEFIIDFTNSPGPPSATYTEIKVEITPLETFYP